MKRRSKHTPLLTGTLRTSRGPCRRSQSPRHWSTAHSATASRSHTGWSNLSNRTQSKSIRRSCSTLCLQLACLADNLRALRWGNREDVSGHLRRMCCCSCSTLLQAMRSRTWHSTRSLRAAGAWSSRRLAGWGTRPHAPEHRSRKTVSTRTKYPIAIRNQWCCGTAAQRAVLRLCTCSSHPRRIGRPATACRLHRQSCTCSSGLPTTAARSSEARPPTRPSDCTEIPLLRPCSRTHKEPRTWDLTKCDRCRCGLSTTKPHR